VDRADRPGRRLRYRGHRHPAGISGAVLLLPFQVSVLGTPSPAVTPTNLLYNVIATPAALYRYRASTRPAGDSPSCSPPGPCPASSPDRSSASSCSPAPVSSPSS